MKKLFSLALATWAALAVETLAQSPRTLQPPTPAAGDGFGTAVVAFGNDILVGAPGDDSLTTDAGAVYLFEGGTGKLLRAFTNPSPDAGDSFGSAIAVSGSTIVIGAPGEGIEVTDVGAAYLFDGNTGAFLDALLNPNSGEGDRFGSAVAIGGNTIIIGAPFVDAQSPDAGAVYLFDLGSRQLQRIIPLPDIDDFARFGTSVAAVGNGFAVGTPSDGDTRIASFGSIYFYDDIADQQPLYIPNPLFQTSTTLQDSLRADNNGFGQSVAAFGNSLLAGAPFNPDFAAVYLVNSATGNRIQSYPSPNPGLDNRFGFSAATVGSNVLVGAPGTAFRPGAAYLFDGNTGQRLRSFANPDPRDGDNFGFAVAVAGNDTLISAPGASNGAGVVYAFGLAVTCQLTRLSPLSGGQTCEDSIQVKALIEITGGVRPFNLAGTVNGTTASFSSDTLFAGIPLAPGANTIIVNCTITDSTGAQTVCTDTTTITGFAEIHDVVINEILYDPNYDDLGTERIELKNVGADTTELDGFALWIRHEDVDTYWLFPDGISIAPGDLLTVHWLKDGSNDDGNIFTGLPADDGSEENPDSDNFWGDNSTDSDNMALGGAGNANDVPLAIALVQQIRLEEIAEFREACRMVDFVQIGGSMPAIDTLAAQAGLWNAGEFLNFVPAGHSYEFDTTASPPILTTPGAFTDQTSPSVGFKNVLAPPPSQHLLISEVCVRPAVGEFVEIHNPTTAIVSLRDYYLTDNVNLRDNAYTLLVQGLGSLNVQDGEFLVKFPDGAQIGPGEYQTIAFRATDFRKRYGQSVNPTYEINSSDLKVPDMIALGLGAPPAGLTDAEEAIILLRWDGTGDLIEDVDYVAWGAPLVNKTALGLDGVDSASVQSYYDNETSDSLQKPAASQAHALLKSWQRRPAPREFGELGAGGNGISGHDETSENLARAFKQAKPTPNRRARGLDLEIVQKVVLDTLISANGDGILNPGEDVRLRLRLRNNSPDSTGTLFSILRSPSPLITIRPDSTSAFANLDSGASVLSSDFYEFSVAQTSLPDSIDFVLVVIDKEAGSADTTHLPFALAAASPLPNLTINSAVLSMADSALLFFIALKNNGNTNAVDLSAKLVIPGIDSMGAPQIISNVNFCLPGQTACAGKEEKLQLAISTLLRSHLTTAASLPITLRINSGGRTGEMFTSKRDTVLEVPLVSLNFQYPKSTVLVSRVRVDLIESTPGPVTMEDTTRMWTDNRGQVSFNRELFDLLPASGKTYRLKVVARRPATADEAEADLFAIDFSDGDLEGTCRCSQRVARRSPPPPLPPSALLNDALLGNVDQSGDLNLNTDFTLNDCAAINAFLDGLPGTAFTGRWRVAYTRTIGAASITTVQDSLEINLTFVNSPITMMPENQRFVLHAMLAGDLNASWEPLTPPVYKVVDPAPPDPSCSATAFHALTADDDGNLPSDLPKTLELYQNYPNPLSAAESLPMGTTIRFALPKPVLVSVQIYDVLGKLVKNLVAQQLPAGFHSVIWRGDNDNGERVVSGIYLVRLQAGQAVKVQRAVLLR